LSEKNGKMDSTGSPYIVKKLQKFVKISKNLQKFQKIGAFWTAIEVPPCANLRAGKACAFGCARPLRK
jgi:hypothetical protein